VPVNAVEDLDATRLETTHNGNSHNTSQKLRRTRRVPGRLADLAR